MQPWTDISEQQTLPRSFPSGKCILRQPFMPADASRHPNGKCILRELFAAALHACRGFPTLPGTGTGYRFMRMLPLVTAAISSGAAIHTSPSMECLMALAAQAKSICAAGFSAVTTRPAISVDSV